MRKSGRRVSYVLRRGIDQVVRTPFASAAVALAIAASLIAVGFLRLAAHNLEGATAKATSGPALIVYVDAATTPKRVQAIADALDALDGTDKIAVVTREAAKARLELELADDAEAVSALDVRHFPASIEVGLRPGVRVGASLHPFLERLHRIDGVESVDLLGDSVDRASILVSAVRSAARALSLLLCGCAVFVVVVLVRAGAERRAADRSLYRSLGASVFFAAGPELVAGCLRGLGGGLISAAALYAFYASSAAAANAALGAALDAAPLTFLPLREVVLLVIGGGALGLLGVSIADRSDNA